ncbi:MAG: hypothetical protein B6245_13115 [Desulfobacteraceae bacterium 4572_88]|nr:MAG: hypothetical protein B6245_13115 [Desulfobacteraceae bacterium 4572_88]RLC13115.1 MAG: hypothetical protein DRI57_16855 [Deltaproteobacteria bacterium]
MKKSVLNKGKKYTFSDYFELNNPTKEILREFGYEYDFKELNLPETKMEIRSLEKLRNTYVRKLPFISLNSETAKREFYISPLLLEILDYLNAEINVEYPLDAGENLSGTIDYLIKYSSNILIVEAKKGDLEKGFNQLAIELIAMDKYEESPPRILYGAVTLGDIWRFGILLREEKQLKKDMNAYVIPSDLERLLAILLGILETQES